MKITIQPTGRYNPNGINNCTVTVELPDDDLNITDVINELIKPALVAWGFNSMTVNDALNLPDT